MKYFILSIFSFTVLLASCATLTKKPGYKVQASILPHIEVFNKHYRYFRGESIPFSIRIYISEIRNSKQAAGVYYVNEDYTILSKSHWDKYSYYKREMLFFHEMGHHVLRRQHYWDVPRKYPDGCPKSLMYWKSFSQKCYMKRRSTYIKELFKSKDTFKHGKKHAFYYKDKKRAVGKFSKRIK